MADEEETELTKFPLDAEVEISFDAQDVAANLTREQALKFVRELDEEMNSWPLTLLLAEYFSDQVEVARKEGYTVVGLTSEQLVERIKTLDAEEEVVDGE